MPKGSNFWTVSLSFFFSFFLVGVKVGRRLQREKKLTILLLSSNPFFSGQRCRLGAPVRPDRARAEVSPRGGGGAPLPLAEKERGAPVAFLGRGCGLLLLFRFLLLRRRRLQQLQQLVAPFSFPARSLHGCDREGVWRCGGSPRRVPRQRCVGRERRRRPD